MREHGASAVPASNVYTGQALRQVQYDRVRVTRAPPHASFQVRNVLNEARTSSVKIFGCSHAAKWQPLGVRP